MPSSKSEGKSLEVSSSASGERGIEVGGNWWIFKPKEAGKVGILEEKQHFHCAWKEETPQGIDVDRNSSLPMTSHFLWSWECDILWKEQSVVPSILWKDLRNWKNLNWLPWRLAGRADGDTQRDGWTALGTLAIGDHELVTAQPWDGGAFMQIPFEAKV